MSVFMKYVRKNIHKEFLSNKTFDYADVFCINCYELNML